MARRKPRSYQRGYPNMTPHARLQKAMSATERAGLALWDALNHVETAEIEAEERDLPRRPVNKIATAADKMRDMMEKILDLEDYLQDIDV